MKNKTILYAVIAVIILAAAGFLIRPSGSVPAPSAVVLSHDEAANLISGYLKSQPPYLQVSSNMPIGFNCPDRLTPPKTYADVEKALVSEGYLSEVEGGAVPTAKAQPYVIVPASPSNYNTASISLVEPKSVEVTGVSVSSGSAQADFAMVQGLTPFGEACEYQTASGSGTAVLRDYDSGWKVISVSWN